MDPITSTIVAALPVIGSEFVKSSVRDAYDQLKTVIHRKWGKEAPIAKAVDDLQANAKSKGQELVLQQRVSETNADKDPGVMEAVEKLIAELKEAGTTIISGRDTYEGNNIINSQNSQIGPREGGSR
jgi:Asp-tRNA(Asn)/Glu-tRNA(Gln) amidotransferase A subunit family amidase